MEIAGCDKNVRANKRSPTKKEATPKMQGANKIPLMKKRQLVQRKELTKDL
jgi:hypothetical protein